MQHLSTVRVLDAVPRHASFSLNAQSMGRQGLLGFTNQIVQIRIEGSRTLQPLLLPCAPTGLASIATWCGSGTIPSGSAVVTCLNATARTRRAERAVQSDVLSVWQVLHGMPSALRISAQRVARFDDHCTSNLLINNKLRQRYSRFIEPLHLPLKHNFAGLS